MVNRGINIIMHKEQNKILGNLVITKNLKRKVEITTAKVRLIDKLSLQERELLPSGDAKATLSLRALAKQSRKLTRSVIPEMRSIIRDPEKLLS
jgi:hypothetical protein